MRISFDLPTYAIEALAKEAEINARSRNLQIEHILVRHADAFISARWWHVKARECSRCGEDNRAPIGCQASNATAKRCRKCGKRLSALSDRIGVVGRDGNLLRGKAKAAWYRNQELWLEAVEEMRIHDGYPPPPPARTWKEIDAALKTRQPGTGRPEKGTQ